MKTLNSGGITTLQNCPNYGFVSTFIWFEMLSEQSDPMSDDPMTFDFANFSRTGSVPRNSSFSNEIYYDMICTVPCEVWGRVPCQVLTERERTLLESPRDKRTVKQAFIIVNQEM